MLPMLLALGAIAAILLVSGCGATNAASTPTVAP